MGWRDSEEKSAAVIEKFTAVNENLAASQRRIDEMMAEMMTVIRKQIAEQAAAKEAAKENKKALQRQNTAGEDFPSDEPTSKEGTTLSIDDEEPEVEASEIMDNNPISKFNVGP
ncbi:hypothetical protein ACLB2K_026034 [Fragaria x ananassa]